MAGKKAPEFKGYSISFITFMVLLVGLASANYYWCSISGFFGITTATCQSIQNIEGMRAGQLGDRFRDTEATSEICQSGESVDYSDVTEYLRVASELAEYIQQSLDGQLGGDYRRLYSVALRRYEDIDRQFRNIVFERCYGGARGDELSLEVSRMANFLYNMLDDLSRY